MTKNSKSSASPSASKPTPEQAKQQALQDAKQLKSELDDKTKQAAKVAEQKASDGLTQAGEKVDDISSAVDSLASTLSDENLQSLSDYAHSMSDQLSSLSNDLKSKSANELATDVKNLAQNNPYAFLLGSVAVGFALSRFLKASAPDSNDRSAHASAYATNSSPQTSAQFSDTPAPIEPLDDTNLDTQAPETISPESLDEDFAQSGTPLGGDRNG